MYELVRYKEEDAGNGITLMTKVRAYDVVSPATGGIYEVMKEICKETGYSDYIAVTNILIKERTCEVAGEYYSLERIGK